MTDSKILLLTTSLLFCLWMQQASAQRDSSFTYEAVVEGNRKILLRDATKINSYPTVRDSVVRIPTIQYNVIPVSVENKFAPADIQATRIQMDEKLPYLYRGYVRAGIGNFFTTPVELGYTSGRSKMGEVGVKYQLYRSSGLDLEDNNIPDDFTDHYATVWGNYFLKNKLRMGGDVSWNGNTYQYYGLDSEAFKQLDSDLSQIDFRQRINTVEVKSHLNTFERDTGNFNFSVDAGYRNTAIISGGKENQIDVSGSIRKLRNDALFKIDGGIIYNAFDRNVPEVPPALSYEDVLNDGIINASVRRKRESVLINVRPTASVEINDFRAVVGAGVYLDANDESRPVRFYPLAEASYNLFDGLIVPLVGISGQTSIQSYYSLYKQNPFVSPFVDVQNLNERLNIYARLAGALSSSVSYRTGVAYKKMENMPLFVNTYTPSAVSGLTRLWGNAFAPVYDKVSVLNVFGELSFYSRKSWNAFARGEFFNFKTDNEISAWQLPQWKVTSTVQYTFKEKFIFSSEMHMWGSRVARSLTPVGNDVKANENGFYDFTLKPLFDLGLKGEYRYNKRLSVWCQFGNALGLKYRMWSGFPAQRFLAIIGASYSF